MTTHESRQQHWDDVYARKHVEEVSWFEPDASVSLDLIGRCDLPLNGKIIDVGGGAARLVDGLLARGFGNITVLDLSAAALAAAQHRLGARGRGVQWIAADVTAFEPPTRYALWHDRAVFHFLTSPSDRDAYVRALERAVQHGGHAIVGTFALDGPEHCSGLDVVRYDGPGLAAALGPSFTIVETLRHTHVTPAGKPQAFTFVRLARH